MDLFKPINGWELVVEILDFDVLCGDLCPPVWSWKIHFQLIYQSQMVDIVLLVLSRAAGYGKNTSRHRQMIRWTQIVVAAWRGAAVIVTLRTHGTMAEGSIDNCNLYNETISSGGNIAACTFCRPGTYSEAGVRFKIASLIWAFIMTNSTLKTWIVNHDRNLNGNS